MSAQPFGGPIIIPLVAKSLQELLGTRVPELQSVSTLALRADPGNAATVWLGLEDVTTSANQLGFMAPGEPINVNILSALQLGKLFLVGNGADKVYVSGVCY